MWDLGGLISPRETRRNFVQKVQKVKEIPLTDIYKSVWRSTIAELRPLALDPECVELLKSVGKNVFPDIPWRLRSLL